MRRGGLLRALLVVLLPMVRACTVPVREPAVCVAVAAAVLPVVLRLFVWVAAVVVAGWVVCRAGNAVVPARSLATAVPPPAARPVMAWRSVLPAVRRRRLAGLGR
ncbi:hypothetical protein GCM10009564_53030 [Streptomyces thermogriseus]|uniref:Secreted protein n=1 Tax=Streptomyces thermogriseus TaxID=75292 RepID=A0ABP4DPK9_9ACTN